MTSATTTPRAVKWPFFLGDLLLVGLAGLVFYYGTPPLELWRLTLSVVCVFTGAWLAVLPYLLEYRAASRLAEADALAPALDKIQNLEKVATQISQATTGWQMAQDQADKTTQTAREIAERVAAESKAFAEFLQKANDAERAHLRLEVEKLHRLEGDWVQVTTCLLDHVYALHQAGVRSGQTGLIQQLTQFQSACRDVIRRVGLVPYEAPAGEPFDSRTFQLRDPGQPPPAGARVAETLITGFTYQGQLLRRAIVTLQEASALAPAPSAADPGATGISSAPDPSAEADAPKPASPPEGPVTGQSDSQLAMF